MKKRGWLFRGTLIGLLSVIALLALGYFLWVLPFWGIPFNAQRHGRPPITPEWALECWLWEDDVNTEAYVNELLEGYAKNDIPVRTILIDSPWSTRYNDFIVDETRYPKPAEFFDNLKTRGYRIVLWMTCLANSQNADTAVRDSQDWYEGAKAKGYLAGNGSQTKWWKGRGGFIDYSNPEAMKWWRGLQQQVFDWGLDGWKLDGADTLFSGRIGGIPIPYQWTHAGLMTTRGYMDHYARDEYQHGLTQNPEFITLIRSIDGSWAHPEGFAPIDAAPVTWVGDRQHAWKSEDNAVADAKDSKDLMRRVNLGIEGAIRDILQASKLGYCVVGDDIGGYHGKGVIPPRLYIRWAEFGAFTGLFLNGGHGERALWKRSQEELEIIRKFSWLHTELVPYMYSHVVMCHEGGKPLIRPVKGKYHYMFGDDFLVAPIYQDSLINAVTLPEGRWRYLFNDHEAIEGPTTLTRDFPLDEFPVYVRDGAIIPMNVSRNYTGFGDKDSEGFTTFSIYPNGTSTFAVRHPDTTTTTVRVATLETLEAAPGETLEVSVSGGRVPILRILLARKPSRITLIVQSVYVTSSYRQTVDHSYVLAENTDWHYDDADRRLWVKTRHLGSSRRYIISP